MVCEGTDFAGAAPGLDFDLNARLANALALPGAGGGAGELARAMPRRPWTWRASRSADKGCELFGVVVSRVPPESVDEVAAALQRG